jgi:7-cyano-7-deazaguanine synthase
MQQWQFISFPPIKHPVNSWIDNHSKGYNYLMKTDSDHKAVCLVSGGMDSAVTLAMALRDYEVHALHVMYGQRTEERELKSFRDLVEYYDIKDTLIISMDYIQRIGASSLTDRKMDIPSRAGIKGEIPNTYVPFRNAQILSAGVSWAEAIGAAKVFIGAVEEDSSGYPDCREIFFKAFNVAIHEGTRPESNIEIVTPVIHLSKSQIVKKGIELKVPFNLTWSCYRNSDKACGVCESCTLRSKAFKGAGIDDPILPG